MTDKKGYQVNRDNRVTPAPDLIRDVTGKDLLLSTFGQLLIATKVSQINGHFAYGIPTTNLEQGITGSGEIAVEDAQLVLRTSAADGTAFVETIQAIRYVPGSTAYGFYTVRGLPVGEDLIDTKAKAGIYDLEDGFFIGSADGRFLIGRRRYNPIAPLIPFEEIFYQNSQEGDAEDQEYFNLDPLDGTGYSGFDLKFENGNIFGILYAYLGFAPIAYCIKDSNDNWIPYHIIKYPNTSPKTHLSLPYLPLRVEIDNSNSGKIIEIGIGSVDGGVFDGAGTDSAAEPQGFNGETAGAVPKIANGSVVIAAFRSAQEFKGRKNKLSSLLNLLSWNTDGATKSVTLELIFNPTETVAGTWVAVDSNTPVEYSLDVEYDLNTGASSGLIVSLSKDESYSEFVNQLGALLNRGNTAVFKATGQNGSLVSGFGIGYLDLR